LIETKRCISFLANKKLQAGSNINSKSFRNEKRKVANSSKNDGFTIKAAFAAAEQKGGIPKLVLLNGQWEVFLFYTKGNSWHIGMCLEN
jgi:hypothetical protein